MTFFGEYYFTNFGEYIFENLNKSLKLSQILVTKFLKISLIQQNFHQFWWKKMCKIINKYCHQFRWNFHHLITHYFLWFTKKIPRIGENSAKDSSENQDGLLPLFESPKILLNLMPWKVCNELVRCPLELWSSLSDVDIHSFSETFGLAVICHQIKG